MSTFDHLSGCVWIRGDCPDGLREGLEPFYEHPNDARWGSRRARILYHESIHFWQLLSSGYLGTVVLGEWRRLLRYERTGILDAPAESLADFESRQDRPFAPRELAEAWARFWDVHTRSPVEVIAEEGIPVGGDQRLKNGDGYSGEAFDWVQRNAPDCRRYGAPYRWLLGSLAQSMWLEGVVRRLGIRAEPGVVASYVSVLIFPVLAHRSFGTPWPVEVFCACVEYLDDMPRLLGGILRSRVMSRSINEEWLASWRWLNEHLVDACLDERYGAKGFDSGLGIFSNVAAFREHEVYTNYVGRLELLKHRARVERQAFLRHASPDQDDYAEREALTRLADEDVWAIFSLPGQPNFRTMLGEIVPPPCVRFDDRTIFAPRLRLAGDGHHIIRDRDDPDWRAQIASLRESAKRYADALFAQRQGLSPAEMAMSLENRDDGTGRPGSVVAARANAGADRRPTPAG